VSRHHIIALTVALIGLSGPALALSIAPANCEETDGTSYWQATNYQNGLVAANLRQADAGMQTGDYMVLASCKTNRWVKVSLGAATGDWHTVKLRFEDFMQAETVYGFADISAAMIADGYDATVEHFSRLACLCDSGVLESMDITGWTGDNQ
jgi:hypothetical protein